MGIQNTSSSFIFLFEGLILGTFGAVAGVLLGLGSTFAFTQFAVKPDGTPVVALLIDPQFIVISGAIAVGACILASLIPARKSSALNPIDIIRNG
jgi:lipoprotein-releasing system permease protein